MPRTTPAPEITVAPPAVEAPGAAALEEAAPEATPETEAPRYPTLSPSRAADFKTCPLLYRFRTIDRLPERPTADQVRGTLVHAVLERLFDLAAADRTPAAAAALVEPQWQRLLEENEGLADLFTDAAPSRRAQPEPQSGGGEHAPNSPGRARPEPGFGEGEHAPNSSARAQRPGFGGGQHAPNSPGEGHSPSSEQTVSSGGPAANQPAPDRPESPQPGTGSPAAQPGASEPTAGGAAQTRPGVGEPGAGGTAAELLASARRLLGGYFTVEDPRRIEPAERESLVSTLVHDQLLIRGYIDRLDVSASGDLRVVDYKTGGAPREAFEARALFQLKFYALVLWRTRGVVPRVLRLLYLKDAEICDYAPDPDELVRFERTVLALWRAIEQATNARDFRPKPSRLCGWCSYQEHCPAFGGTPPPYPEKTLRRGGPPASGSTPASDGQDRSTPGAAPIRHGAVPAAARDPHGRAGDPPGRAGESYGVSAGIPEGVAAGRDRGMALP